MCRHVLTGLRRATGKDLLFSAARSEDGEAFAFESVREKKGFGHFGFGCGGGQIDGFRDSAVAISLKHRLHTHMLRGRNIVRCDKESA